LFGRLGVCQRGRIRVTALAGNFSSKQGKQRVLFYHVGHTGFIGLLLGRHFLLRWFALFSGHGGAACGQDGCQKKYRACDGPFKTSHTVEPNEKLVNPRLFLSH